jgi:signal transduction histidine kinase
VALVNDKFDFSEKAIELRRKKGSPVAEDLIATGRGNQLMANIRKQVFKIENYEQNLKQQYKDEKGYQFKKATSLLFAGDILSILLFISTFIFLRVEIIRRREVEYELIGLNDELKTKNEKHLQTERLLQKITSDLSESNKELELFAYVSSHDLKQPIRMIVSFMQLFEKKYKGKVDAEGEKYIKFIVDGAKQMDELIEALLDYSHISKTSLRTFALTEMAQPLKQAMNNLKMNIEETHANITYDDDLPAVKMEPALMTQLFQNLIANAIKFKGKNPPQVHVRAYKEGNDWVFCVKDNGIGISETFFDKIFVVFYKLHIKSECPGSGIGLAICKRIVEHHGGRIWVESKEGHGSTFFFSIPA